MQPYFFPPKQTNWLLNSHQQIMQNIQTVADKILRKMLAVGNEHLYINSQNFTRSSDWPTVQQEQRKNSANRKQWLPISWLMSVPNKIVKNQLKWAVEQVCACFTTALFPQISCQKTQGTLQGSAKHPSQNHLAQSLETKPVYPAYSIHFLNTSAKIMESTVN